MEKEGIEDDPPPYKALFPLGEPPEQPPDYSQLQMGVMQQQGNLPPREAQSPFGESPQQQPDCSQQQCGVTQQQSGYSQQPEGYIQHPVVTIGPANQTTVNGVTLPAQEVDVDILKLLFRNAMILHSASFFLVLILPWGIIAMCFATRATSDYRRGDKEAGRWKTYTSLTCLVFGLIFNIIFIALFFSLYSF